MDLSTKELPNFDRLDCTDGTILGRYNKVSSVNPHKCRFVATYPGDTEIKGIDLFTTGWEQIPNGLVKLRYELSTGHIIEIPKFKAYLPMIEVSFGMDGSKVFHYINVNCLADKEVIIYKIVLRQDQLLPQKIGDVIMSRKLVSTERNSSWKYTS